MTIWAPTLATLGAASVAAAVAIWNQRQGRRHEIKLRLVENTWTSLGRTQAYLSRLESAISQLIQKRDQAAIDSYQSIMEEFSSQDLLLPPELDEALSTTILQLQRAFEYYGLRDGEGPAARENLQQALVHFRSLARKWKKQIWHEVS